MASSAEILLFGDDPEQLDAVADMAFAEIARVEQLLSRFDPASELSRINREAALGGCLVDFEMLHILFDCRAWWFRTEGAFDIAAGSRDEFGSPLTFAAVELDASQRRLSFRSSGVRLDLGAYGKGYALDRAARLIRQQRVTSALLHLGTSSVLAIGSPPDAEAWLIGLRDPDDSTLTGATGEGLRSPVFFKDTGGPKQPPVAPDNDPDNSTRESQQVLLANAALSTSATRHSTPDATAVSDLIDPRTGQPLLTFAACSVVAPTASTAEALSTAFVVLGRDRAEKLLGEWNNSSLRAIWTQGQ